ncbi:hypothetical protein DPMN_006303 [Dreissena polymorpha]|uniref:Uncharacterized protein n=1 Tax=Dreissena polymorpha TaxID=45954 RepID=A0A9D4MR79_DREPO|nr:hypothetical protein DPMN_006303 [Dreissena polymorpha]
MMVLEGLLHYLLKEKVIKPWRADLPGVLKKSTISLLRSTVVLEFLDDLHQPFFNNEFSQNLPHAVQRCDKVNEELTLVVQMFLNDDQALKIFFQSLSPFRASSPDNPLALHFNLLALH